MPSNQCLKSQLAKLNSNFNSSGNLANISRNLDSNSAKLLQGSDVRVLLSVSKIFFISAKNLSAISVCECPDSNLNQRISSNTPR